MRYPIAKNGIFKTVQGEGALLGVPMVFVRLAGCSVGCPQCDTDYGVSERLSASEIGERVKSLNCKWSWVTGGEPADHDLWGLLESLRLCGHVALATSGSKPLGGAGRLVEFLSVSPHSTPDNLVLFCGTQINLVPGLNGLRLEDWDGYSFHSYQNHYITPLGSLDGLPMIGVQNRMDECLSWIGRHPEFRLGVQAHKAWGVR